MGRAFRASRSERVDVCECSEGDSPLGIGLEYRIDVVAEIAMFEIECHRPRGFRLAGPTKKLQKVLAFGLEQVEVFDLLCAVDPVE